MGVSNPHLKINTPDLKNFLSEKEWLVEETEFDIQKINSFETKFTVGNGYLGTRGSLEEGHRASWSATYINGIFDHHDSFIVDLVNSPDWTAISVWVEGLKLNLHDCKILDYYRALDMKKGFLFRETRFQDREDRITRYQSIRYAHLTHQHLFEVIISVTPENYSGTITVQSSIDGHVFNLDREPAYKKKPQFDPEMRWEKWTKSKHLTQVDSGNLDSGVFLKLKTLDRPHHLIYGSVLQILQDDVPIQNQFEFEKTIQSATSLVEKGSSLQALKTVSIYTSRDVPENELRQTCETLLKEQLQISFEQRLEQHQNAWNDKWKDCDIVIHGDARTNHAVRFNIYHLLITANPEDHHANIGAKSLSGEGYKGHVFWDTEIFTLPFYIFTQPETAKALMTYRFHTMEGARDYAVEGKHRGIRYPWESADTGHETTPPWSADGTERIWTGEREIHITSAIVFGLMAYYTATHDHEFLQQYAAEILFETARFWDSRLEYNKSQDRYELTEVEGPDEFHELVNNSVYTNWLTKWSLEKSVEFYDLLQTSARETMAALTDKLKLSKEEVQEWKAKAEKIYIPYRPEKKLIEEFEGYFNLKEVPITEWDENNMPQYPEGYNHSRCGETTLIKQPDVIMLLYILPDEFTDEIKKVNYEYYEPRTMHKSSLSPSIHTIMGIETNHFEKALQYFESATYVDLIDNQGNADMGIHIASAGGTWQAMVNGFGGMRVKNQKLTFKPWLPDAWKSIEFKVKWRGDKLKVTISHDNAQFFWSSEKNEVLNIDVLSKSVELPPNKLTSVELRK